MGTLRELSGHMDWWGLASLLLSAAAALLCITFHEGAHGLAAWHLGDPTARQAGRLTLNPIRHIDPFGLVMMLVAGVGWAKPVPVDMRYFRRPKRDMALTALAGPCANFVMAFAAILVCGGLWRFAPVNAVSLGALSFFADIAVLSVGLGLFNLIPVPPLDGSKALFALLPDRVYGAILRYERYVMIALVALTLSGVFDRPLSWAIRGVLGLLCRGAGVPVNAVLVFRDLARAAQLLG